MGTLIGLIGGLGLAGVYWALVQPGWTPAPRRRRSRLADLLASVGETRLTPGRLVGLCVLVGMVAAVVALGVTGVPAIGLVAGVTAAWAPIAMVRARVARRLREHAELWPDAVDNLASAIRAGLSLPEALMQLGERGPDGLRPAFVRFADDYRASGRFDGSLDLLKSRLADPVGDRVIEGLRIARDVGGGDVGRMLRSLSTFLRDDLRTRGELESRQSWTINGARLAVANP